MNIASFALASAVAAVIGCAQPALAQSQDQTGAANRSSPGSGMNGAMMNRGSMMNDMDRGNATTGAGNDERSGNRRDDDENNSAAERGGDGNQHRRWSGNDRMGMGMGPMMMRRRHQMMRAMGGAQFHFARGKARIDVRCSVQEDMQACVRAATELLDKIAALRNGGPRRGDTTGSATGGDDGRSNGGARRLAAGRPGRSERARRSGRADVTAAAVMHSLCRRCACAAGSAVLTHTDSGSVAQLDRAAVS